jgi:hypothetical protein
MSLNICGGTATKFNGPSLAVRGTIVDRCGISYGSGRWWLRRSCGKISPDPAATFAAPVVDASLANL